jgi:ATP-dependent 26S proteasome regulatory subunit
LENKMMENLTQQLATLVRAGWPGILVQSAEEGRVDRLLQQVADGSGMTLLEWNLGYGWVRFNNKQPLGAAGSDTRLASCLPAMQDEDLDGKLLVIKGAALALDNDVLAVARLRQLLNRVERHHRGRCTVVLLAERITLAAEIEPLVAVMALALPGRAEIEAILAAFCGERGLEVDAGQSTPAVSACSGLSELELHTVLATVTVGRTGIDATAVEAIVRAKEQVIAKSGVLEMVPVHHRIDDIGGLADLKDWMRRRAGILGRLDEAMQFGVKAPKGVLIAGMPGCGKSLTAKVAASLFRQPLLRLDIGSLLGKYVGESEHNMRRALQMAESVSPCVLWVDELEKAFVGLGSGGSEVSTRLLGYFLTWMQEKSSAVFVIATANDVSALPPELLRKGRFDEIFYVGFPNTVERTQILHIHLRKAGQDAAQFDLAKLAERCRDYAGADIESAINEALENAFLDGTPLTQALLLTAIEGTVPLRETLRDKVGQYEELFEKLKLKPASGSAGMSVARMIRQAEDPNQVKREEVATHPDCPDNLLEKLVKDSELAVRTAAYRNPRCPEYLLSMRINIGKEDRAFDEKLRELACTHPNAPVDLLIRMINEDRFPEKLCNAIARSTNEPGRIWQECLQWQSADPAIGDRSAWSAFAANPALPIELQRCLLKSVPEVRQQLSCNSSLFQGVREALLLDEDRSVRVHMAAFRCNLDEVQLALASDEDADVRAALAGRHGLSDAVQSILAVDRWLEVRQQLASNRSINESTQVVLENDAFPSVRERLKSSAAPEDGTKNTDVPFESIISGSVGGFFSSFKFS